MAYLPNFIDKMNKENLPRVVIDTFAYYYRQVAEGATGLIPDSQIRPVTSKDITGMEYLDHYAGIGENHLRQSVLIVLNGGLGTSMGLSGPKSLLTVKNGKSFLQIILEQAATRNTHLAFMNSFSTDARTRAAVTAISPERPPRFFLQHKFPKILRQTLAPARWPVNSDLEWNPPGHGEIYTALHTSGLLSSFLKEGIYYALIVNSDNLGATMDPALLGFFINRRLPFMMEVSQRTPTDMKGGHIARHRNGRLVLREIAQCPREDLGAFQDIQYYRYFNVNSLWVDLRALQSLIRKDKVIHLPIIINPKTLDPRDKTSPPVYQIETAMGAAISLFEDAAAVEVFADRFRPVKKCADLLAVRSDCFIFLDNGHLAPNPARRLGRIEIHLDETYYGKIDDFESRFPAGAPSLVACESLVIEGDVRFEKGVTIKGRTRIRNLGTKQAAIRAGTVITQDLTLM